MSNLLEFIVQWLERGCSFEVTESMPAGSHNRRTPSILSFQALDVFIEFMQSRYQTTRMRYSLVLCEGHVRSFYRSFTPTMQTLWPDSSPVPFVPQSPVPFVSKSTTAVKPSMITRPLPEVMQKHSRSVRCDYCAVYRILGGLHNRGPPIESRLGGESCGHLHANKVQQAHHK